MRNGLKWKPGKISLAFAAALIAAVAVCLPGGKGEAEAKSVDVSGRGIGYTAVLYDGSNGLPTYEANDVAQSGEGYIWIGGYSGLIRYDGNDFYRYGTSSGVASVNCLFVDSSDRLWIGTNDSGVAVMEGEQFVFYDRSDGLKSSSIRSISEDGNGNIIVATTLGLAYVGRDGVMHAINEPQVDKEYVCELNASAEGVVYGVTNSGDYFVVKDLKVTAYFPSATRGFGTVNTIFPDPEREGYVYLGTTGSDIFHGEINAAVSEYTVRSVAPLENVNTIRIINGDIWICADKGIGYFHDDNFVDLEDIPMNNSIDRMMEDYEGNLWFTSSRQGVMKIVENRFSDVYTASGLPPLVVNTTCKVGKDLYIGTDATKINDVEYGGVYVLDENYNLKPSALSDALGNVRVRCIRRDSAGNVWVCTRGANGLVRYDPETEDIRRYTEEDGLASNTVRMITELSDGRLAVATNGGVNIITDGEISAHIDSDDGISNLEILCIEEGADGELYLGSDGGGIYVFKDGVVTRIGREDGLKSEVILRLKKDPEENLFWIITSNSVAYLKDGRIKSVDNFPYSNNFDVYFDENDRMWVLSSGGIYVAARADFLSGEEMQYTLYDTKRGLPGVSTANSYSHLSEDGTLYVSSSTGVYTVNINDLDAGDVEIKMSVPYIVADDVYYEVGEDGTVRLPADVKRISVHANAFTYTLSNPHLSYRLEGFDDAETRFTKQTLSTASYTNLRGGTYRFVFSMHDELTDEVKQTVYVTIIKQKALTEEVWFIIALALVALALVVAAVYVFMKIKTKAFLRKQEENRKLINEMTHVFARCIDMKDAYTNGHSTRVAKYTAMMAAKLGKSKDEVDEIYNIALLHDIGKISIPDNILNKPGRLNDEEYAVMKSHSPNGYEILKDIDIAPGIALGAGYHHEKFDGTGYPSGLKGDEIPEVAQIIAVADAFDAMYSTRPYRRKMELKDVVAEIKRCSGSQFNPKIVEAFLKLVDEGAFDESDTVA